MKREILVLVTPKGKVIGSDSRERCHGGRGRMHLAYLILIFNSKGELLMQKRSRFKKLWPGYWDGSTASHVLKGETFGTSLSRELKEELGISCPLKKAFSFSYFAPYEGGGVERELCHIFIGKHDGAVQPNPKEVADWKWESMETLTGEISRNPNRYTPWLRIAAEKLTAPHKA